MHIVWIVRYSFSLRRYASGKSSVVVCGRFSYSRIKDSAGVGMATPAAASYLGVRRGARGEAPKGRLPSQPDRKIDLWPTATINLPQPAKGKANCRWPGH